MKYSIRPLNINNIEIYEENKLSPRSYFIHCVHADAPFRSDQGRRYEAR